MKQNAKFRDRREFIEELLIMAQRLLGYYEKIDNALTRHMVPVSPEEGYHFLTALLRADPNNKIEAAVCRLLAQNMYQAELVGFGAGDVVFVSVLKLIVELAKSGYVISDEGKVQSQLSEALTKVKYVIECTSRMIDPHDLNDSISRICGISERDLSKACFEAVNLAGLEGRIFIENGKQQDHYVVELKDGYLFRLKPYNFFLEQYPGKKWDRSQCKALVVDGFVESISEIDGLLSQVHDKKQPMAIFAHGFSEEVISTLFLNLQKGKLDIIPVRLKSDIASLNVINDIGVVCGMDPISSLKGQLLSYVKFDDLPTVDRLVITEKETSVENFKSRLGAFEQVRTLLAKREDNRLVEDLQDIVDQRIRSLSPNVVHLYLPESNVMTNESRRMKLDLCLRQCKALLNYGLADGNDCVYQLTKDDIVDYSADPIPSIVSNELEHVYFSILTDILHTTKSVSMNNISAMSLYVGLLIGSKLGFMLAGSSGFVELL